MWLHLGGKAAYLATMLLNLLSPVQPLVQKDIAYAADDRHRADIYRPPQDKPEQASQQPSRPVVVFLYGGGWRSGSKESAAFVGTALARWGFVVVIPEYRHVPEVGLPDILADSAEAVAWTIAHAAAYGGDPRRVVVAGHSSGAWAAAMLALDARWLEQAGAEPDELAGMIGLAGPYAVSALTEQADKEVFAGSGPEMEPIHHRTARHPSMLLLAGTADMDVLPSSTLALPDRMPADGDATEARLYPGFDHGGILGAVNPPSSLWSPVAYDIWRFVDRARSRQ